MPGSGAHPVEAAENDSDWSVWFPRVVAVKLKAASCARENAHAASQAAVEYFAAAAAVVAAAVAVATSAWYLPEGRHRRLLQLVHRLFLAGRLL